EEAVNLVKVGQELIASRQISEARLLLERATKMGSASAALALGSTYDPIELDKLRKPTTTHKAVPTTPAGAGVAAMPSPSPPPAPSPSPPPTVSLPLRSTPAFVPPSPKGQERSGATTENWYQPDVAMAQTWYQRAKDLGSPEAAG